MQKISSIVTIVLATSFVSLQHLPVARVTLRNLSVGGEAILLAQLVLAGNVERHLQETPDLAMTIPNRTKMVKK